MAQQRRMFKVSERIREIIASSLLYSDDPRFNLVTITAVSISSDLREAKVYWSIPDSKERKADVEAAWEKGARHFRKAVADGLDIKFVPNITYVYDETQDTYERVQELMKKIEEEKQS